MEELQKLDVARLATQLEDTRVLVVGDSMLDRYVDGVVTRLTPEDPTCVVLDMEPPVRVYPGGAANVAANLATMGAQVKLVSLLSEGMYADQFVGALRKQTRGGTGSVELCSVLSDRRTSVKTRYCHRGKMLLRVDDESREPSSILEREGVTREVERILEEEWPQLVILSDYAKGVLTGGALISVVRALRFHGMSYVVDPKREELAAYGEALAICPNEAEWEKSKKDFLSKHAVVTQGGRGCEVFTLSVDGHHAVIPSVGDVEVFDPSGAGDSFLAALALGCLAYENIHVAAWLANVAARLSVMHRGTAAVTQHELFEELRRLQHASEDQDADRDGSGEHEGGRDRD